MKLLPGMDRLGLAVLALALGGVVPAVGGTLYWDGNGDGAGVVGTGTWDNTTANWNTQSDYSGSYVPWTNASGQDVAWFPTNGGSVTIVDTVKVNRIVISTNNPAGAGKPTYTSSGGTIELTGPAEIVSQGKPASGSAPVLKIYSSIIGSQGLTSTNSISLQLYGTNTYSGNTAVGGGANARLSPQNSKALPATTIVRGGFASDGCLEILTGITNTVAGIETNVALVNSAATAGAGLILDRASGTSVWSQGTSTAARDVDITKRGDYTQVFSGQSKGTRTLNIGGGVLALNCAGFTNYAVADDNTAPRPTAITLSGGVLRLDRAEQIQDAASLTMIGGVFNLNGFSETISNLTVAASTTLDFGSGAATNTYLGSAIRNAGTLTVTNWSGNALTGGGTDQLRVTALPAASFLDNVQFVGYPSGSVASNMTTYYEILPVIDTSGPTPPSRIDPGNGTVTTNRKPTFTWNAVTDDPSGISRYDTQIDATTNIGTLATSYTPVGDLVLGTHSWYVRAVDNATPVANTGTWSATPWTVIITESNAPSAPTLVSPTNGEVVASTTPTFTWNAATDDTGIDHYQLNIDGTLTNVTSTNHTPSAPLGGGPHAWAVRAFDSAPTTNAGPWSVTDSFTISTGDTTPPGQPNRVSPTNTEVTANTKPTFVWNQPPDDSGISRYDIRLDNATNSTGTATNYTPGADLSFGDHTWSVRAVDGAFNTGDWNTVTWTVTVLDDVAPAEPTRVSPTNGASSKNATQVFVWSAVTDLSGIARYDIEIDATGYDAGTSTSYTSTLSVATHTWRVRAVDGAMPANTGAWSSAYWTNTIIESTPPAAPTLAGPTNTEVTADATPTFTWNDVADSSGIARYDIWLDNTTNSTGTATNFTPGVALALGSHTWKVRAVDGAENIGNWSDAWTVTVVDATAPAAPGRVSPTNGAHVATPTPTFTWNSVADESGVARYDIQIDAATYDAGMATNYTPAGLLSVADHTWKVRAVDGAGNTGDWSSAWTVTVDPFPLYWDGNGTNLPNPSGTGTWDAATSSNWNTRSDYSGTYCTWEQGGGGEAWFPTNGGTVSLVATVTVSHVMLATNPSGASVAYTFTNGTLRLTGAARIAMPGNPAAGKGSLAIYSAVGGTSGLWVSNRVDVTLHGSNSYSGATMLGNSASALTIGRAAALPVSTVVTSGPGRTGKLVIDNGVTATAAGIEGSVQLSGGNASTSLVLDRTSGTSTWTEGTLGTELQLIKRGAYTQVFGAESVRTETLSVEGGVLVLDCPSTNRTVASSRDATHWSRIAAAGGELRLNRPEQIQDTAALTMTGGTFNLNGFSEALSNLTVAANSVLDFGAGAATNTYLGAAAWVGGRLTVTNWTGTPGTAGGQDQFLVVSVPSESFLSNVQFAGYAVGAVASNMGAFYEVLPYVDTTGPDAPSLARPSDGSSTTDDTPEFVWNAVADHSGISRYDIALDDSTNSVAAPATNYVSGVLGLGLHSWAVRAVDGAGNTGAWSTAWTVSVVVPDTTAPAAPALVSPTNTESTVDRTPTFVWNAAADPSGIARYDLWIDGATNAVGLATNYTPGLPMAGGAHTWQVRAVDGAGNTGDWSSAWSVTVDVDTTAPAAPVLISPTNTEVTADLTPTFTWGAVADASGIVRYDIRIDGATNSTGTATDYTPAAALGVGPHGWQVRAVDGAGNTGEWSAAWSVTAVDGTAPPAPSLLSPSDASHVATPTPTFAWAAVPDDSGISRYDLRVDAVDYNAATATNYTPSSLLSVGAHTWRARAVDGAGNTGDWSSAWAVTVDPFPLYWDGNGAAGPTPSGTGTWDSATTSNWNTRSDYSGVYCTWAQGGGGEAWFPTLGGATGVITVAGTVTVSQLTFATNTADQVYNFTNGVIALSGPAMMRPAGDPAAGVAPVIKMYSSLAGNSGLTVSNRLQVTLYGTNTYTGASAIGNASAKVTIAGRSALPATTILCGGLPKDGDVVIANAVTTTVAGIETNVMLEGDTSANSVLIMDRAAGTSVWSFGTSSREIGLVKRGAYSQVFAGSSSRTKSLQVEAGTVALDCPATNAAVADLTGTQSPSVVLVGGTLRLQRPEQIQDTAAVTMSGGVFHLNGYSETVSNLTVAADSWLDFGTGAATQTIVGTVAWTGGLLTITNWSGSPVAGGGADQLRVLAQPPAAFLSSVRFSGYAAGAMAVDKGTHVEVVPCPPGSIYVIR